jgi:hypothetical protein
MTIGFSYLMAVYTSLVKEGDVFKAVLPKGKVEFKDDVPYLEYFANGGCPIEFMKDVNVWGEDLTAYDGFAGAVASNLELIKAGKELL